VTPRSGVVNGYHHKMLGLFRRYVALTAEIRAGWCVRPRGKNAARRVQACSTAYFAAVFHEFAARTARLDLHGRKSPSPGKEDVVVIGGHERDRFRINRRCFAHPASLIRPALVLAVSAASHVSSLPPFKSRVRAGLPLCTFGEQNLRLCYAVIRNFDFIWATSASECAREGTVKHCTLLDGAAPRFVAWPRLQGVHCRWLTIDP
jgi:hypothetical protein